MGVIYIYILVGGLEHVLFFHVLGIIIPTDQYLNKTSHAHTHTRAGTHTHTNTHTHTFKHMQARANTQTNANSTNQTLALGTMGPHRCDLVPRFQSKAQRVAAAKRISVG